MVSDQEQIQQFLSRVLSYNMQISINGLSFSFTFLRAIGPQIWASKGPTFISLNQATRIYIVYVNDKHKSNMVYSRYSVIINANGDW